MLSIRAYQAGTLNRRLSTLLVLTLTGAMGIQTPARGQTTLLDDFNRPDGTVGNGWTNTLNNVSADLEILSAQLSSDQVGGAGGVYRPLSFTDPVRVTATLKETVRSSGAGGRFESFFLVENDTHRTNGYGLLLHRTGIGSNNSAVTRVEDGIGIDSISSPFQFTSCLELDFTFDPDGSIVGTIVEGANSFSFAFGTRTLTTSAGGNFSYSHSHRGAASPAINPRLDDLRIETCPEASSSNYGTGFPGTLGVPALTATAPPIIGGTVDVFIGNSLGAPTVALILVGLDSQSVAGSWGGDLLVLPAFTTLFAIPAAGLNASGPIEDDSSLCAVSLFLQVLQGDTGAANNISSSAGLQLEIGY
jgi:hypothetical protein